MIPFKTQLLKTALDALYYTRAYRLFEPVWGGVGAIFMLHHVRPATHPGAFSPNRILEVTPEFLEQTIQQILAAGHQIVTLDEAVRRLVRGEFARKFVCFTLDDGYLDNYLNAYPIFKRYNAPFTIYVNTALPDGSAVLWWWLLEEIVRDNAAIEVRLGDRDERFPAGSVREKHAAFNAVYWKLRVMPHAQQYQIIEAILERYSIDPSGLCRASAMSWDMIAELASSGLATIGAHTVNHFALSKLQSEDVRNETEQSREIIAQRTGNTPRHFAYPYGDAGSAGRREFDIIGKLGFTTATTTRKGLLFPEHAHHLHALPRVSLNGEYQHRRYVELFLSGAPFTLWQGFRRLDVN